MGHFMSASPTLTLVNVSVLVRNSFFMTLLCLLSSGWQMPSPFLIHLGKMMRFSDFKFNIPSNLTHTVTGRYTRESYQTEQKSSACVSQSSFREQVFKGIYKVSFRNECGKVGQLVS